MNNLSSQETKNLCLSLMKAQNSEEVVEVLKKNNLWDNLKLWRNYGDKEGSWATINNQGNPPFALTEKITNAVDAVLMNKCFESGKHPKSEDRSLPSTPIEAVHKYFESKDEIKNYDIEKTLFEESKSDIAGLQEFWNDKKAREVAENINISVGGDKEPHPNITIIDKGEGQTPEKLPTTIMSLHTGNKKSIAFAQGKWNQGGSGAILHTGQDTGIALQFVLTKRNPKIVKIFKQERTKLQDNWSFTVLRRDKPSKPGDVSEAKYLCPIEDEDNNKTLPLNFFSDEMPIFPEKGKQFFKKSNYGTVIILYEYKMARNTSAIFGDNSLYRRLDAQLPKLPLPVRVHETRKKQQTEREQALTLRGFSNFQENQYLKKRKDSNLEEISPRRGVFRCQRYKINYDIFCFKKNKGKTYIPKNAGLLWTVNGQTHAVSQKDLFRNPKVAFDAIIDDLIIVIDCSALKGADREDFFKSSRDRLNTEFQLYKEVRERLIDDLSNHTALQELIQKRIDESVKDDEITDEDTIQEIQKLLKELPDDEKDFLPPGFQIKQPQKKQEGSGKFNLPKKKFPSFFCFEEFKAKNLKEQIIEKEVEIEKTFSLRMFTDAETDYFERKNSPGKISINWEINGKVQEPDGCNGPFLENHGLCSLRKITLPEEVKVGEDVNLKILVKDKENKEGFILLASVLVKPKQIKQIVKKKKEKKSKVEREERPPEGRQGENIVEEIIENPLIAKYADPEEWKEMVGRDPDEDDVLHVVRKSQADKLTYNLFLNRTNINLRNEKIKANQKYTEKIIETKYKMGISLIAMFSLMQYRKDKRKKNLFKIGLEGEQEHYIDDVLTILIAAKNAGKGLFMLSPYLEKIGKALIKKQSLDSEQ